MTDMAYTEQQRADTLIALEANGGNIKLTSEQTGIPRPTIYAWLSDNLTLKSDHAIATAELIPATREAFKNRLTSLRDKVLGHLEVNFEDLSARESVVALGILIDKVELLEGNATSRTAVVGSGETIDEAITRITNELELRINRNTVLEVESSTSGASESEPETTTGELVELVSDGGSGIWQDSTGSGVASSPSDS